MSSSRAPALLGLVLAGGDSRRMGADKGSLRYHRVAQARWLWEFLGRYVERCFVSINAGQQHLATYAGLPQIIDSEPRQGPATGLLAAHNAEPAAAWLIAAVDLVCLDDAAIRALVRSRQPDSAGTALQHADGTIEPLCAIWEPAGLELLAERVRRGDASARRCLESANTNTVRCAQPRSLQSIDTPGARNLVRIPAEESGDAT